MSSALTPRQKRDDYLIVVAILPNIGENLSGRDVAKINGQPVYSPQLRSFSQSIGRRFRPGSALIIG